MKIVCALIIFSLFKEIITSHSSHITVPRNYSLQHSHRSNKHQKICNQAHCKKSGNKPKTHHGRIIGGELARIEDHPFTACLVTKTNGHANFECGAVIVGLRWVVTAAHCVSDLDKKFIIEKRAYIRSDTSKWMEYYKEHRIIEVHIHEKYNKPIDADYDIAAVKVQEPFSGKNEKVINLANSKYKYVDKSTATVVGWGTTDPIDYIPLVVPDLRYVEVKLVGFKTCRKQYKHIEITRRMLCAVAPGKDACVNDSGGPLYQNKTLIGVVSWGSSVCGDIGVPGVYTKISVLHQWILQKIKKKVTRW